MMPRITVTPGTLIWLMLGIGAVFILVVIVQAGRPAPNERDRLTVDRVTSHLDDFDAAFPPRPLPQAPLVDGAGSQVSLTQRVAGARYLIVFYAPNRCGDTCADEWTNLQSAIGQVALPGVSVLKIAAPTTPLSQSGSVLVDETGQWQRLAGGGAGPILILYDLDEGQEIGRAPGTQGWSEPSGRAFLEGLAALATR